MSQEGGVVMFGARNFIESESHEKSRRHLVNAESACFGVMTVAVAMGTRNPRARAVEGLKSTRDLPYSHPMVAKYQSHLYSTQYH